MFRRDSKVDAFQRQISALRHQLGGDTDDIDSRAAEPPIGLRDSYADWTDVARLEPLPEVARVSQRDPLYELKTLDDSMSSSLAIPAIDEQTSVLSHTTRWTGNLDSTGSLHVHGRVEGSLVARDTVFIAEEAEVDAVVRASAVTIAGTVRGSIHCSERFEVLPRGRMSGDVHAPIIVIHDGAIVAGEIAMTGANEAHRSTPPVPRAARS